MGSKSARLLFAVTLGAIPLTGHVAARADWGMADPYLSTFGFLYPINEPVTLLVVPDGSGPGLTAARTINRQAVDATVVVHAIEDGFGWPLVGSPRDQWSLGWDGAGVAACTDGLAPDHDTLADGSTAWSAPLRAGGHSHGLARPYWLTQPMLANAGLALQVNSPDLNGDLVVDLIDVTQFAQDYAGGAYQFRSDLSYDGVVNLSDIIPMVQHYGARCP